MERNIKFLTLNYLQRIEPADAHVLEKYLKPEELNSKLSNGFEDVGDRENWGDIFMCQVILCLK